jgi:hypothetical protein
LCFSRCFAPLQTQQLEQIMSSLDAKTTKPLNRSKIQLMGRGRAGKTSLVKSLLNEPFDEKELSTVGCTTRDILQRNDSDWGPVEIASELARILISSGEQVDNAEARATISATMRILHQERSWTGSAPSANPRSVTPEEQAKAPGNQQELQPPPEELQQPQPTPQPQPQQQNPEPKKKPRPPQPLPPHVLLQQQQQRQQQQQQQAPFEDRDYEVPLPPQPVTISRSASLYDSVDSPSKPVALVEPTNYNCKPMYDQGTIVALISPAKYEYMAPGAPHLLHSTHIYETPESSAPLQERDLKVQRLADNVKLLLDTGMLSGDPIVYSVWDLAGQTVFHEMLHLLMTK